MAVERERDSVFCVCAMMTRAQQINDNFIFGNYLLLFRGEPTTVDGTRRDAVLLSSYRSLNVPELLICCFLLV